MNVREIEVELADGTSTTLGAIAKGPILVVNVASKCGLTPQYTALEALQKRYGAQGFTVLGVPSNQFLQEPGDLEQIQTFCSTTYGVTFPLTVKSKVNGRSRSALYAALTKTKDSMGLAGPVMWNFEKFLVRKDGSVVRFRPKTVPDDAVVISAIEADLA